MTATINGKAGLVSPPVASLFVFKGEFLKYFWGLMNNNISN
jgi:hypothetical protein